MFYFSSVWASTTKKNIARFQIVKTLRLKVATGARQAADGMKATLNYVKYNGTSIHDHEGSVSLLALIWD